MYISSRAIGRKKLSFYYKIYYLSQYVKIFCIVVPLIWFTHANQLKVVIASGLTSSHSEQSS